MKYNRTAVIVVLDKSGSMSSMKQSIIDGFNSFLNEQKTGTDECLMKVVEFNGTVNTIYPLQNVHNVPYLSHFNYNPDGGTALYDAIGQTIDEVSAQFASMPEEDRPARVVFLTLTDGEENASQRYVSPASSPSYGDFRIPSRRSGRIATMIAEKQYQGWQFLYIGANQDSIINGGTISVQASNSVNFNMNEKSIGEVFRKTASKINDYRCLNNAECLSYSAQDRRDIVGN